MNIQPFRAILPILTKINASEAFFDSVREGFPAYEKQGFFQEEEEKAVFFYEIKTEKRSHHGVIAALDLADFAAGKVKKHEKTLLEKERQQMSLLIERGAMVKPVLLTYRAVPLLQRFMKEYTLENEAYITYTFQEGKEIHRFWKINDSEKIGKLQDFFKNNIPFTYVADGHHRLTTNVLLHQTMQNEGEGEHYNQIYCAFFADEDLTIGAFNRAVNIDVENFLEKINTVADSVENTEIVPQNKYQFSVFYQAKWHVFTWKTEILAEFEAKGKVLLDVDILNEKILKTILGIEDIRKDERIVYVEGAKGTVALEKICTEGAAKIAFSLYPVAIEDLMAISDDDGTMPPKSTFFEPRMKNGIMIQGLPIT
jgi:uncharacterized protein (DUF1015 family)